MLWYKMLFHTGPVPLWGFYITRWNVPASFFFYNHCSHPKEPLFITGCNVTKCMCSKKSVCIPACVSDVSPGGVFETVLIFIGLIMVLSHPLKEGHQALPLSSPISSTHPWSKSYQLQSLTSSSRVGGGGVGGKVSVFKLRGWEWVGF